MGRAALEQADPPLIVAASTNNQAVTNIIDSFGKDFGHGQGAFAGRWLPDIKSFGLFLAAASREAEASAKYQTERFFEKLETREYLGRARAAYLEAARNAFPYLAQVDVAAVVDALQKRLHEESVLLVRADEAYAKCREAENTGYRILGDDPGTAFSRLSDIKERCTAEMATAEDLLHKWEGWLAAEPTMLSLFGFLPPVAKKRALRARVFLRETRAPDQVATVDRIDAIDRRLKMHVSDTAERAKKATDASDQAEQALEEQRLRREAWRSLVAALLPKSQDDVDLLAFDRAADRSVRFPLFLLATHYWEGRWLLEMEKALPSLQRIQKNGRGGNDRSMIEPM